MTTEAHRTERDDVVNYATAALMGILGDFLIGSACASGGRDAAPEKPVPGMSSPRSLNPPQPSAP